MAKIRGRQPVSVQYYDSPCGEMVLASVGEALCLCDWNGMPCACRNKRRLNAEFLVETSAVLEQAKKQLGDYFACRRKAFNIPLRLVGTDFQQQVWEALLGIPYGETVSYKDIALRVGNPEGVRAVAQAVGANGIAIFIPCHRVVGINHSLTGFAGGLEAKRMLLEIENKTKIL